MVKLGYMKDPKKRTLPQNRLYWKWLTELAKELVDHGVDMRELIEVPIMATPEQETKYVYTDLDDNIGLSTECKGTVNDEYLWCKVSDNYIPVESYELLEEE